MSHPLATKWGSFYLNAKMRNALLDTARSRTATLPTTGSHATATVTDKLFLSLRTEDPETAKTRFRRATHGVDRYLNALANGPQPLIRTRRSALAGEIGRKASSRSGEGVLTFRFVPETCIPCNPGRRPHTMMQRIDDPLHRCQA